MADNCATCRFWVHDPELHDSLLGQCCRYAPTPITVPSAEIEADLSTFWPTTAHNSWCGDYSRSPSSASANLTT